MKVTIIGTGYVGLVSGTCLAEVGNDVLCLDIDSTRVRVLEERGIPIYEPGLLEMVQRNVEAGRLHFTTDMVRAVAHGIVQFITVNTPPNGDGAADLKHVLAAAGNIGKHMIDYKVVVNKSTVPVGTVDKVKAVIAEQLKTRGVDVSYSVISNPEFLREGAAIEDFMRPDRIVVGADDEQAIHLMRALYAPFNRNHDRLLVMNVRSAELTKYAANAMIATRISFMNEIANLAERLGADIELVRRGIGSDPRIGYHSLYAGCGYGGACLPKDVRALIKIAEERDCYLQIAHAVEAVNNAQKHVLGDKIKIRFGHDLRGRKFALWGLAFKPNTDDIREAPSRELISDLLAAGAGLVAYDPAAMSQTRQVFGDNPRLVFVDTPLAACDGSDALVIVTEWREFRSPDFDALKSRLKHPVIFDGRNLFEPKYMKSIGIDYVAIGRLEP